ncbi:MAG TPA: hypothetical protein VMD51_14475 [Mycobacterium sp.]|nr:hypothetical protein [Mycobacterium sp.]
MTATEPRPRAVDIAFWLLVVGAVLLMAGGLLAITIGYDTLRQALPATFSDQSVHQLLVFRRGAGVICVLAGAALAFLVGRSRTGDVRYRRATLGLGLTLIVLVGLMQVFVNIGLVALLSLLPIIVGVLLLSRPPVAKWFNPQGTPESDV